MNMYIINESFLFLKNKTSGLFHCIWLNFWETRKSVTFTEGKYNINKRYCSLIRKSIQKLPVKKQNISLYLLRESENI